jgi:transcriptional regulator with GAF, ATPase, and Fis domain
LKDSQSLQEKSLLTCVEIGKAVTATLHMDQILEIVFDRLSRLIRAKNWTLFLVDPIAQELRFEVVAGLKAPQLDNTRIKIGEGIAGTAAQTGEPILVPDVAKRPALFQEDRRYDRLCHPVDYLPAAENPGIGDRRNRGGQPRRSLSFR